MEINGKTYRNLESQVGYLTDVAEQLDAKITEVAAQIPSKMIVEELPDTGDPLITYYVGPKGTEPNLYYEVWVWVQEEPDGPFVWRELEDTDQVDLSGYLQKDTSTTPYAKAYIKKADGTQDTVSMTSSDPTQGFVAQWGSGGRMATKDPVNSSDAVNKSYGDSTYLAKQTGVTTKYQLYGKAADGTQGMLDVTSENNGATVMFRDAQGRSRVGNPVNNDDAVNLSYANSNYVLQDKGGVTSYHHVYCKLPDGSQGWINAYSSPLSHGLPMYRSNGELRVATPTDNASAATKAYVDAAVGQLIYHHKMSITYTTVGTDYVAIAAHIDDNASTAYTDVNWHNMPLLVPDYAVYHYGGVDYMASVVKMPRTLHQDEFDEPQDGFMITYWNGSAYVNERINSTLFSTPTVTDVVTTW